MGKNTVGKGEIARYEQFLLFPQVFSKDLYCNQCLFKTDRRYKCRHNVSNYISGGLCCIWHPFPGRLCSNELSTEETHPGKMSKYCSVNG